MHIRAATTDDAEAIAAIYNHYVLNTTVTFEEAAVAPAEMAQRIADLLAGGLPWLVATSADAVVAYAYASKWRVRHAYRFSVESTVYVDAGWHGQGIGGALYAELLRQLARAGYHLVIGGIAMPNDASVRLHEKHGFEKVAQFCEVGFKFGRWLDVGYWQKTLQNADTRVTGQPTAM
jgi:phosphinothricin acetyltransferase